jgi:pimeloyl-ACP methyl ester carboxylesterase
MSTTGDRNVGQPTPEAMSALMQPVATSRDEAIERGLASSKIIGSPGYPTSDEKLRDRSGKAYDRQFYPAGVARQMVAIMAQADRTEALGSVEVPTLVVHGAADPLVQPTGGEATAKAVPGSELLMIEGMGHDLPEPLWPQVVDAIVANAGKAVSA